MISWRRVTQLVCLGLFLTLIVLSSVPLPGWLPVQRVFALDPVLFLGPLLSSGTLMTGLSVLVALFVATALLGRFFCGHVCPLGTTLDASRPLVAGSRQSSPRKQRNPGEGLRRLKYLLLCLGIVAALFGLNLLHWGSPLSLAARFYALILKPLGNFFLHWVGPALEPVLSATGLPSMAPAPFLGYSGIALLLMFFLGLLVANRWVPRFWCRCLCPAGAVLALIGRRPLFRRRVSQSCTECGRCRRECPVQAIPDNPKETLSGECIRCLHCQNICPEAAIAFQPTGTSRPQPLHLPGRRAVLQTVGLGLFLAFLGKAGQASSQNRSPVRPPGAVPESLFLSRCIRCGMCMTVCPTQMLQPESPTQGLAAHFAPLAIPRTGPCEPGCNACTRICPSGAIRILDLEEKMWAKMGTAFVDRRKCLAWNYDRSCLVCDEVCPYGAVELRKVEGQEVFVPFVNEKKCTGCGFCEHDCPVTGRAAIRVRPLFAQRLAEGSYLQSGQRLGLSISRQESAPGPEPAESSGGRGLPPGFSE